MKKLVFLIMFTCTFLYVQSQNQPGLHVDANYTVLFGADTLGSGNKLMWLPSKGAFRAGYSNNFLWDTEHIGQYSVGLGYYSRASGIYSTAMGAYTDATGDYSTAMGNGTSASGDNSTAMGYNTDAIGDYSTAMGEYTDATGDYSTAMGYNTEAYGFASLVIGTYNDPLVTVQDGSSGVPASTPLLIIGNGKSQNDKSNALEVYNDGTLNFKNTRGNATLNIDGKDGNKRNSLQFLYNGGYRGALGWDEVNNRLFIFHGNNALFAKDGKIGIGNINPQGSHALSVNGTASKNSSGSWSGHSDRRLKKNIQSLSPADILQKVLSMRGVSYEWSDDMTGLERPEGVQYGFIAQELQESWPGKITTDNKGYLMATYGDFDPMFVEAIRSLYQETQDLHHIIEDLKAEEDRLKTQNNNMTAQLESLLSKFDSMENKVEKLEARMASGTTNINE